MCSAKTSQSCVAQNVQKEFSKLNKKTLWKTCPMEFSDVPRMCANTYNETTMLLQVRNVHILRQKKLEVIRRTLDEKNFFWRWTTFWQDFSWHERMKASCVSIWTCRNFGVPVGGHTFFVRKPALSMLFPHKKIVGMVEG